MLPDVAFRQGDGHRKDPEGSHGAANVACASGPFYTVSMELLKGVLQALAWSR